MMRPERYIFDRIRIIFLLVALFFLLIFYTYLYTDTFSSNGFKTAFEHDSGGFVLSSQQQPAKEILRSLFLTEEQCAPTFPGIFKEIDRAVGLGPFELKKGPDDYSGAVQGRIKNGKVYISRTQYCKISITNKCLSYILSKHSTIMS